MRFPFWGKRGNGSARETNFTSTPTIVSEETPTATPFGRFVSGDDDARGHVALALFVQHQYASNEELTLKELAEIVGKTSPATLQQVYYPGSQRILKSAYDEFAMKDASREVQRSAAVAEIISAMEERHQFLSAQIEELARGSSFWREVGKVTLATLFVTIAVVLLSALPEPIHSLKEGVHNLVQH